ncbi:MAG: hypothetical protein WD004_02260 [Actinomycetota bacterium]
MDTIGTGTKRKARLVIVALAATLAAALVVSGPGAGVAGARSPQMRLAAPAGSTYLNAVDTFGTKPSNRGAFAVGDTLVGGESRPSIQQLTNKGFVASAADDPGTESGLAGVAALSATRAFAVGYEYDPTVTPLVERFNGQAWSIVDVPDVQGWLDGVDALSANDIYAVGGDFGGTLIMHFDGTAWTVMPGQVPNGMLTAVTAIAPDDVYAVGAVNDGGFKTLIMHFDGTAWTVVPSPNGGATRNMLSSIAAVSATDIYAVGYSNETGAADMDRTLVLHFDGTAWTIIPSPNLGSGRNELWGISARSATDIVAVGQSGNGTLIMRFDGTTWNIARRTLRFTGAGDALFGVARIAKDDIYAVGGGLSDTKTPVTGYKTLVHHFNGKKWEDM